jgi:outer membrane lipoprotein-sorting protein
LGLPVLAVGLLTAIVIAQTPGSGSRDATQAKAGERPALQLAERADLATQAAAPLLSAASANEHPLMPALRWAYDGTGNIDKISDYSATLVKRERLADKLGEYQHMFVKVRHKPFSVYMFFISPSKIKGQEVIFVDGKNDGKMWAHTVGFQDKLVGTVSIPPDGPIAMKDQRYPLTELGILNLTKRLVQVAEKDIKYGECEVKFFKNAKIKQESGDRVCTCIQVKHPIPRKNFLFYEARIFVDDELNLPIRYESYDWPKEKGAAAELMEEYTYMNLKLNNGFTDADFDIKNPNYKFR